MFTSNFDLAGRHPNAVNIAREPPDWFPGKHYEPFMPPTRLLYSFIKGEMSWPEYRIRFNDEVLAKVKAIDAVRDLGDDAILLCWCKPHSNCHRRLVADWIETELGIYLPEYSAHTLNQAQSLLKQES